MNYELDDEVIAEVLSSAREAAERAVGEYLLARLNARVDSLADDIERDITSHLSSLRGELVRLRESVNANSEDLRRLSNDVTVMRKAMNEAAEAAAAVPALADAA